LELLCVIAIIVILVALQIGAINKAKESSRRAICNVAKQQRILSIQLGLDYEVDKNCYDCHAGI
tara:strand:+ start:2620 stop:2811 length:192 start_codon:yes stop_codon:yes gene_type:complete